MKHNSEFLSLISLNNLFALVSSSKAVIFFNSSSFPRLFMNFMHFSKYITSAEVKKLSSSPLFTISCKIEQSCKFLERR